MQRNEYDQPLVVELDVSNRIPKLTKEDCSQLCDEINASSNLTKVNLKGNNIGDEGAKILATHIKAPLLELDVSSNGLTDEGIIALYSNRNLHRVIIKGNRVGAEGEEAMYAEKNEENRRKFRKRANLPEIFNPDALESLCLFAVNRNAQLKPLAVQMLPGCLSEKLSK